jgi:hypothetical protein
MWTPKMFQTFLYNLGFLGFQTKFNFLIAFIDTKHTTKHIKIKLFQMGYLVNINNL